MVPSGFPMLEAAKCTNESKNATIDIFKLIRYLKFNYDIKLIKPLINYNFLKHEFLKTF